MGGACQFFFLSDSSSSLKLTWTRCRSISIVMLSPSLSKAMFPPAWASGDTCPTTRRNEPPENRPSVMRPTSSPSLPRLQQDAGTPRQMPARRAISGSLCGKPSGHRAGETDATDTSPGWDLERPRFFSLAQLRHSHGRARTAPGPNPPATTAHNGCAGIDC